MNPFNLNLYGNYRNRTFLDIYNKFEDFQNDYTTFNVGLIDNAVSNEGLMTIFTLLAANYGNSTVASQNEDQFKMKLFSTIFMYGPSWEKRLELQIKARELNEDDLRKGGQAIYNSALNPNQPVQGDVGAPIGEGTNTLNELTYINQQNTTNYKKSKAEAIALQYDLLRADVTREFLTKFKKLFLQVVSPELPLWYVSDAEVDNE